MSALVEEKGQAHGTLSGPTCEYAEPDAASVAAELDDVMFPGDSMTISVEVGISPRLHFEYATLLIFIVQG